MTAVTVCEVVPIQGSTTDTAGALLEYETEPLCHGCFDGVGSSDPAGIWRVVARTGLRDARLGIVAPAEAVYDATAGTWSAAWCDLCLPTCGPPDRVIVRYEAGLPLTVAAQELDPAWQSIVARLAAAELARGICGCDTAQRGVANWQNDARATIPNAATYAYSAGDLDNPFGTRLGQIAAWKSVQFAAQRRGFSV
jgi:hypothetical protein